MSDEMIDIEDLCKVLRFCVDEQLPYKQIDMTVKSFNSGIFSFDNLRKNLHKPKQKIKFREYENLYIHSIMSYYNELYIGKPKIDIRLIEMID